jgi:murein DD-endopeptidase MepM/ murein hydrolase activator NlpD
MLALFGCNFPGQGLPAFVPPSGLVSTSATNWETIIDGATKTAVNNIEIHTPTITATEEILETPITPTQSPINQSSLLYYTQAGDTLPAVAFRFDVNQDDITSPEPIPHSSFINPNQLLIIPNSLSNTTSSQHLLPDSELVFSPSAADFNTVAFGEGTGGFLSTYTEFLGSTGKTSGSKMISQIARNNSINPRLLLALLEYQSGWVFGQPGDYNQIHYPMGFINEDQSGLLKQLKWAVNQLSIGYYGWREGRLKELTLNDDFGKTVIARMAPDLNAGTAALQYYFAQIFDSVDWINALDYSTGFPAYYESMFGNPWMRAQAVEPLFPPDLVQPQLSLPFLIGPIWSYTGGPHGAWERDGSWAAIDFAPASTESGCVESGAWVSAVAPGLIVRSELGIVVLDLDGDGSEQTGWVLIYLHMSGPGLVREGEWVEKGDLLGHPSCEGGYATGTHLHLARKYNGEWMTADGPAPFILSGWIVNASDKPYLGTLVRGEEIVTANQFGAYMSRISRTHEDP